jgi:hypothetical protein
MGYFNKDNSYTFAYGTYSHEYAHTMGFDHSSGLAYGWDDHVMNGIKTLLKNHNPDQIPLESSPVYFYFDKDKNSLKAYSVSGNLDIHNIEAISDFNDFSIRKEPNNTIKIEYDKTKPIISPPILFNSEISGSNKLINFIVPHKYQVQLSVYDSNGNKIHTFPDNNKPATFKITGTKQSRSRTLQVQYEKVGVYGWRNLSTSHLIQKDQAIDFSVNDSGWSKSATYPYRVVEKYNGKEVEVSQIFILAPK